MYLPEFNQIIELQGPNHYLKPGYKEYNASTDFKTNTLKRLGYNVVDIPFSHETRGDKSLDHFLIDTLKAAAKKWNVCFCW